MRFINKTIWFNRSKEENRELVDELISMGMDSIKAEKFLYLGYEVGIKLRIYKDGRIEIREPLEAEDLL